MPHGLMILSERLIKAKKRRYGRKYRSSGLEIDKQIFKGYCNAYYCRLNDIQTSYHRNRFSNADQRPLFREVELMTSGRRANTFSSSLHDPANQLILMIRFTDFIADDANFLF